MFAALYGELVPHAWHDPKHDAEGLFYHRSLAMGWIDDTSAGGGTQDQMVHASGLWGTNDAGWDHPLGTPGTNLISWFQVGARAVAGDRPLPVQPFLRCAEDATARAGTLNLSAVQIVLPIQILDASSRPPYAPIPSMRTVPWFAEHDPRSGTPVDININSGRDPSIRGATQQFTDHLDQLEQDVFVHSSHIVTDPDSGLPPPIDDRDWNGPARHGVVLHGELAEWSCDTIGWLAETIADIAVQLGIRTPLLLTVTRVLSTN